MDNIVITCTSEKHFDRVVADNAVSVVKLWAPWCGPCKAYSPIIEDVCKSITSTDVAVLSVDVDAFPNIAARYGVRSIPTVLIMNNYEQTPAETIVGVKTKEYLVDIIDKTLMISDTYHDNDTKSDEPEVFASTDKYDGVHLLVCPKNDAVRELYADHGHFHAGDAGIDLFITEHMTFKPNTLGNKIKLGVSCSLTNDESYLLMARSSIVKTPLRLSNALGLIDANYRGEIMAVVDNISAFEHDIAKGDRLFQLVPFGGKGIDKLTLVDTLSETDRGSGGFGSTGK